MQPQELNEVTRSLWGNPSTFTPWLISRVFGDGKKFIGISPTFYRPYFYVLRVDSKCKLQGDEFIDLLDEIYDAVDADFGPCCEAASETGECDCSASGLPAIGEWGGSRWWKIGKQEQAELGLQAMTQ